MRKINRGVRALLTLIVLPSMGCGIHGAAVERPKNLLPEPGRSPQLVLNNASLIALIGMVVHTPYAPQE